MKRNLGSRAWIELAEDGSNLEVEDFLSMRLAGISALIHRNVTRLYLSEHDLSLPEWRTLSLLARRPPMSPRQVNSISGMDKGQISRSLALLAEKKLVERRPDAADGRRQVISVTRQGIRLFERILPDARRSQAALLNALSVREREVLQSIMVKLTATAQTFVAPAAPQGEGGAPSRLRAQIEPPRKLRRVPVAQRHGAKSGLHGL